MEPFEVNPRLRRAAEEHERAYEAENAHRMNDMTASEAIAANVEGPFSMRLGARERTLLFALARESGKSMSQLAREILVEGLLRLSAPQGAAKPDLEPSELGAIAENVRHLTLLAQSVEAQVERITRRTS